VQDSMEKFPVIIISPSGDFYGSEQVLYDYVTHSGISVEIAVPANSFLFGKLKAQFPDRAIYTFQSLLNFYTKLFLKLVFNRYHTVYLNEAGHVKYLLLLSKLLPWKKIVIHVRIVEDTARERWFIKPGKNVTILAISNYLATKLPCHSTVLYDPFPFSQRTETIKNVEKGKIVIGIIGRITLTKGLSRLIDLLKLMKERGVLSLYQFKLYGTYSHDAIYSGFEKEIIQFDNVTVCGFESSKEKLYSSIDCIMHLSSQEALGRIYFEAIEYCKPFIGLRAAGVGEIAELLQMEAWMANPTTGNLSDQLLNILQNVRLNYAQATEEMASIKPKAKKIFDISAYTNSLDKLLMS
jgi:glycosyltransferase involved in cell wall biosynthesis